MTPEEQNRLKELEEENLLLKKRLQQRDAFIRSTMASFLSDEVLETVLEDAAEIPNLMIFLNTDEPDWQTFADELARRKCLF